MQKPLSVLSLFSGCGGLDLGFVQAGFHLIAAFDHWGPAVETHQANEKLIGGKAFKKSLSLDDGEVTLGDLPHCDIVLGGPPCQGFSFAGKQYLQDPRNALYRDFVRVVEATKPRVFLLENVRGMEAMALSQAIDAFTDIGYEVVADLGIAVNFGIAQRRERLFMVGFRSDLNIRFKPPETNIGGLFGDVERRSILDAIGDLPEPRSAGDELAAVIDGLPAHLANHVFKPLPESVQHFVRHIPNGGCFRDAPRGTLPARLVNILDNPVEFRSPRLFPKPDPSQPSQTIPADTNPSLGGVLAPDFEYVGGRARPVVASQHIKEGVYVAPKPSRRITPREAARLQSFPDDFIFPTSLASQHKLIGNAVPVSMAKAYAERIRQMLPPL